MSWLEVLLLFLLILSASMTIAAILIASELRAENVKLWEHIITQKQIIQAYRDELLEWRKLVERVQAENDRLHKLRVEVD